MRLIFLNILFKKFKNLFYISIYNFFVGVLIISIFYNFSSNLKNLYLGLKSNYTEIKNLAVITNNGLWIKDIYNENILMINASSLIKMNF